MEAEVRQAAGQVGRLLSMGKSGKEGYALFDLNHLITETASLHRTISRHLTITANTDQSLPPYYGSKAQMEQVLDNLVINAKQAIGERQDGAITITTQYLHHGDSACPNEQCTGCGKSCVRMVVADNGTGIPEDILPHIFEPFFTSKPEGSNSGLGLSVVYKTIKDHGGNITVDSEAGRGTAFTITLPLLKE